MEEKKDVRNRGMKGKEMRREDKKLRGHKKLCKTLETKCKWEVREFSNGRKQGNILGIEKKGERSN
jgi:hypothetical protein